MAEVYVIERGQIVKKNRNLIRCSVCGLWLDKYAYGLNDQGNRTRTNCTTCYHLKIADYEAMNKEWGCKDIHASYDSKWTGDTWELIHKVRHMNAVNSCSISKKEMLEQLQAMIREVNEMPEDSMFLTEHGSDQEISEIDLCVGSNDPTVKNAYYVNM